MKSRFTFFCVTFLLFLVKFQDAFIIPEEVLSLYPFLTSKIPRLKSGTDSKLGFGFNLGRHASYQTVIELGPQNDVEPFLEIKTEKTTSPSENTNPNIMKRSAVSSIEMFSDTDGGRWLAQFKEKFIQKSNSFREDDDVGVLDAKVVVPKLEASKA